MGHISTTIRRRLQRQHGEVSSWLLIAAGLAMVAAVAASILSTTVTQLAAGVGYAAEVRTDGGAGPPPAPATEPVATTNTGGTVVDWDPVEGAASYRIKRNGEPILEGASTTFVDNADSSSGGGSDDAVYTVEAIDDAGNVMSAEPAPRFSEMRFGFPGPGETTTSEITVYTEDVRGPGTVTQSTALDGSTYELTETDPDADGQYSDRKETFPDGTTQHITVVNGVVVNNYTTDVNGNKVPGGLADGEVVPEPPPPPPTNTGDGDGGGGSGTGAGGQGVCGSCAGSGGGGYDNPALDGLSGAAG